MNIWLNSAIHCALLHGLCHQTVERERQEDYDVNSVFSSLKLETGRYAFWKIQETKSEKQIITSLPEVSTSKLRCTERKRQG